MAACAAGATLVLGLSLRPPAPTEAVTGRRAKLEIFRVDDTVDPFASIDDEATPRGEGIAIVRENVPVGPGRIATMRYARLMLREGEPKQEALKRFAAWLRTIPLPEDARFGFQDVVDYDDDTKRATLIGIRTFVLTGAACLRTEDVTNATIHSTTVDADGTYVAVTLSADSVGRFEDMTRQWTKRRIAILIDDDISSAPVVQSPITGGHLRITMGLEDPEKALADAKRLERAFRGR